MTIESICIGDQVFVNSRTGSEVSPQGGDAKTWTPDAGSAIECRRDAPTAAESRAYNALGQKVTHRFFFSADIGIEDNPNSHRFHWVSTRNGVAVDRYVRILDYYMEDSPFDDPDMELWIADGNLETTRNNQAEA